MWKIIRSYIAMGIVFIFLGLAVQPAINGQLPEQPGLPEVETRGPDVVPGPFRDQAEFAMALINATTNGTDTDIDGLPDNVELVLGTDWNNSDSDLDRIGDYAEIMAGSDALTADSNSDGLADYFEMANITADLDWDGVPNVWDWDNDGDGVSDSFDISPNAHQGTAPSFDIQLNTSGEAVYLTFQIRPANPETLSFYLQKWDWPDDDEGIMRDMDNSKEDVSAIPMLELNCSYLPDPTELEEYGITVSGSRAFVPILPVAEFGEVVAMKGKMFLPGDGTDRNISVKAKLVWAITGKTDQPQRAIRAASGGYLTCAPDGAVNTSDMAAGDNSTFDWVDYGNGRVAMRAHSGEYLTVGPDGRLAASTYGLESEGMFDLCNYSGQFSFTAFNGSSLTERPNGTIYADSISVSTQQLFSIQDMGYRSQTISLAQYYEDFSVVGFSAEESHRADVSVISSDNVTLMMAAQLKLAYCYVRNSTNESGDISGMLASENITANILHKEYNHTDEAVTSICTDLIPETLGALPPDRILPIIVAMEEEFACIEMSEYWIGYNPPGGLLSVNLSAEHVLTTRTLRLCWYNTSVNLLLDENTVVEEILTWDLSKESQIVLVGLALAWYVGETFTIQIDGVGADFDISEMSTVNNVVVGIVFGVETMDTISTLYTLFLFSKAAYNAAHINKVQAALELLSGGKITPKFTTITKEFKALEAVKCGKLAILGKIMKVVEIVGIVLAIGLAIWAMIAIGNELGWTPTGTAIAVIYFVLETAYAIALFALGTVFPVGTIIAVVIGLIDLITGWIFGTGAVQWLLQQIIKLFVWIFSDMRIRSEVNLDPIGVDVAYGDADSNGIDVGDVITYSCRVYSNVTITGDGSSSDLADSYLVPTFTARAPWGSNAQTGSSRTNETPITTSTKKSTIYNSSATIQPDKPMVNFPMAISLTTDYKVYYSDCWWFFHWFCDRESQSGTNTADWTTIYTDVMPGTIDGFVNWEALKSNDPDGDGLTNDQESANGTCEWSWDSDGDGLGDKYELQVGTEPRSSDSDGDQLNDGCEFTMGSDPLVEDTDGDGLSDFTEYVGYVIPIEFCNQTLYKTVSSDPRLNDTDSDGLDDYVEWAALLNPGSCDTNGDWVDDQFVGYWMGSLSYAWTIERPMGEWAHIVDAKLTPEGDIVVAFADCSLIKYSRDGDFIWLKWARALEEIDTIFIGPSGNIYIGGRNYTQYANFALYDQEMNYIKRGDIGDWLRTVDEEAGIIYSWVGDGVGVCAYDIETMERLYKWPISGEIKFGMDLLGNHDVITAEYRAENCVATYTPEGTNKQIFGSSGSGEGEFNFDNGWEWHYVPSLIDALDMDFFAVADTGNHRVQMLASNGRFLTSFGSLGSDEQSFECPVSIDHDEDHLFVIDFNNDRIQVLNYRLFMNNTQLNVTFSDTDADGLNNTDEISGWNITVTTQFGGEDTYHVTSEPNATDSDNDGLNDTREFFLGCDPRLVDTDEDGLSDAEEARLGTDPAHWDTDGDGLSDGIEITFSSDPTDWDTDGDGLSDSEEFFYDTNPVIGDSDFDDLIDKNEILMGSDPNNPDSDGDFMFDGEEIFLGTDPTGGDSDTDGISDGYETLYGTEPLNNDTDSDGLADGFETERRMNPVSNDTDGDGVLDGEELNRGLNPFSWDTDADDVPDSLDTDYQMVLDDDIVLVADDTEGLEDFVAALSAEANVILATPQDLLANHTDEPNIVLVGKPDAPDGSAGALTGDLLAGTGDVLEGMLTSEIRHRAVRHGVWTPTQTVIMLSGLSTYDSKTVLGIFKSQKVTVTGNIITTRYLNARSCFQLDDLDTSKVTDSAVMTKLDEMAIFNVTISKYNTTNTPESLTHLAGLEPSELAMGKYLGIDVSENVANGSSNIITGARIELYYTEQDLDMTGDGDADDPEDLNESALSLYRFDESANNWTKLSPDLEWVNDTGVNTADIVRYGTQYMGCIWADVTKLSLYGIGGKNSMVAAEVNLTLTPGWNLISFPILQLKINGATITCADDLATATNCTMLSKWDSSSQKYINYIAGFNLPTDPENFAIGDDDGIFVWWDESYEIMFSLTGYERGPRNVHLLPGWNIVGYNRLTVGNAETDWSGQVSCGGLDDICWYDGTTFMHYIFPGTEMALVPTRGYFVWSDNEAWLSY